MQASADMRFLFLRVAIMAAAMATLALGGSACRNPLPVANPPPSEPGGRPPDTRPGIRATIEDAGRRPYGAEAPPRGDTAESGAVQPADHVHGQSSGADPGAGQGTR